MKKVDFFIVGAPKAGTTSLYHYLDAHPDIEMSDHKEPNFFSDESLQLQNIYNIKNRVIDYNHEAKKDSNERFKQTKLDVAKTDILPKYIRDNLDRYREWII